MALSAPLGRRAAKASRPLLGRGEYCKAAEQYLCVLPRLRPPPFRAKNHRAPPSHLERRVTGGTHAAGPATVTAVPSPSRPFSALIYLPPKFEIREMIKKLLGCWGGGVVDGQCVHEAPISLGNEAKNKFNNVLLGFCFKAVC